MHGELTGDSATNEPEAHTPEVDPEAHVAAQATSEAMMTVDTFLYHCWKEPVPDRLVA